MATATLEVVGEQAIPDQWRDVWFAFDTPEQAAITKAFLTQAVTRPRQSAPLLECARTFSSELHQQTRGAVHFALGELSEATAIFEDLARSSLNRWNYLCLARCYNAAGRQADCAAILEKGYQYWSYDFEFVLETASAHFRARDTAKANRCLDVVKSQLTADQTECQPLAQEVQKAIDQRLELRDGSRDIYDDTFVRQLWQTYLDEQQGYTPYQMNTAYRLSTLQHNVENVLRTHPEIDHVIDFGVMNGLVIHTLAEKFSAVRFSGCDRQPLIKELNDAHYRLPNLQFAAGDILDCLPKLISRGETPLLYHCFTSVLCYPQFLRKFYRHCADCGVRYLFMFEPGSFSRKLLSYQAFDEMQQISEPMRGHLLLHNYPQLLSEAGYEVETMEYSFASLLLPPLKLIGDNNILLLARLKG